MTAFNKLVRDRIPNLIAAEGRLPSSRGSRDEPAGRAGEGLGPG